MEIGRRVAFEVEALGRRLALVRVVAEQRVGTRFQREPRLRGAAVVATGVVRASDLSAPPLFPVRGVDTIELGNFIARLTTPGESGIEAAVSDEGGPLALEGRATLSPARAYRLEATITPRPEAAEVLVEGLKFLDPDARGAYEIEFQDQL